MSALLIVHIAACSLGYLLFGVAFVVARVYIHREKAIKTKRLRLNDRFPWSLNQLDRCLFMTLVAGFIFLSLGLPTGVAIQKAVNGVADFSSPRLLFPAAIWFFYLLILAFRQVTGLRGKLPASLAVSGFNFTAFSFLFEMYLLRA